MSPSHSSAFGVSWVGPKKSSTRRGKPSSMALGYAHVHVGGDWGIRLGKGNITIGVRDKKNRKVRTVSIGSSGVRVRGKTRRKPIEILYEDING
jgi:hypothetical protein